MAWNGGGESITEIALEQAGFGQLHPGRVNC